MRIALNAHLLSAQRFGIWTYVFNLLKGLSDLDNTNDYSVFSNSVKIEFLKDRFKVIKSPLNTSDPNIRVLWEHLIMPFMLNNGKIDIFHNPDHILPLLPIKAKKIITVHDLSFYKFPETFPFMKRTYKRGLTPRSIKLADKIIAVSNSTKNDMIDLFDVDEEKIRVVHVGVSQEFVKIDDPSALSCFRKGRGLPQRFVLFLGTIEKRKNLERLIDAFSMAVRKGGIPHKLVIAGKKGWLYKDLFKKIDDEGLRDKIVFISDMKQSELPLLYNLAELFIYPSIYEGFGLPVLESMACGTAVITSNVSSLPEVAGKAALLIDPYNIEEISSAMIKVLSDAALRGSMIEKGLVQAAQFSWKNCAKHTLEVYEGMLKV